MSFFAKNGWETVESSEGSIFFRKMVNGNMVRVKFENGWRIEGLLFDLPVSRAIPRSIGVFNYAEIACAWADANMHLLEDNGRGGVR